MRGADLLGARVYDRDGQPVGAVRDLHFEARPRRNRDGTLYRLTGLECGAVGMAHRLGYGQRNMAGPWPVNRLLGRMARDSLLVEWGQVARIDGPRIDLHVTREQLRRLGEEGDD